MKEPSVPMSSPDLTEAEIRAVNEVIHTPCLSIGPKISGFEKAMAAFAGVSHAVGVSSGTSGLHLCVVAAGVGADDLVITTPFSFISSANCIRYERGIPVFVDVDPATGNIDGRRAAEAIEALEAGPGTKRARAFLPRALRSSKSALGTLKAVLPVDAFGQPADIDPILGAARKAGVAVIEDACEAIGSEYKGRKAGALGDVGVFAFYPNKQMTTGEGGIIVTDRGDWDRLFRSLRNQGRDVFDAWLTHSRLGYNYRLDEMSAALGLAQLTRIEELLSKRQRVAGWYNERLKELDRVEVPVLAPTTTRISWFIYVIRLAPELDRTRVMARLEGEGIPSRPYFSPIHLQPCYAESYGYRRGDFPAAERLGDVSLALPFSSVMTESQVDRVCEALGGAIQG